MKKVIRFVKKKSSPIPTSTRSPSVGSLVYSYNVESDGNNFGGSKLHVAVYNENLEKVKKILSSGRYDTTVVDGFQRTPLHLASSNGNVAIIWQLLNARAGDVPLHRVDNEGATPLHRAIDGGHSEAAQMLLDKGCPLDISDAKGNTALHLSVLREFHDLTATLLRKGANPDLANRAGDTPLVQTIQNNRIPLAQLFLRCGASVNNVKNRAGATPLMLACGRKKPQGEHLIPAFVEQLLDYDADPEDFDLEGRSATDYARDAGNTEVVELLQRFIHNRRHETYESEDHSFDDGTFYGADEVSQRVSGSNTGNFKNVGDDSNKVLKSMEDSQEVNERNNIQRTIENLSSWSSSSDSPVLENQKTRTVMDLSKILTDSPIKEHGAVNETNKANKSDSYECVNIDEKQNIYDVPDNIKVDDNSRWSSSVDDSLPISPISQGEKMVVDNEIFNTPMSNRRTSLPALSALKKDPMTSATFSSADHSPPKKNRLPSASYSSRNTTLEGLGCSKKELSREKEAISEEDWDDEEESLLDMESLKAQIHRETERKLAIKEELDRVREDQERLSDENEELKEEVSKVLADNKNLKTELVEATVGIQRKVEIVKRLETELTNLSKSEKSKHEEIDNLLAKLNEYERRLGELQLVQSKEQTSYKSNLLLLEEGLRNKTERVSVLEGEIARLKREGDEIEKVSNLLENKDSVLESATLQYNTLFEEYSQLKIEMDTLKNTFSEQSALLESTCEDFREQLEILKCQLSESETELNIIRREKDLLTEDKERMKVRLNKEIEMLRFQNQSFEREFSNQTQEFEKKSCQLSYLKEEANKKIIQLERDNQALYDEKSALLLKFKSKEFEQMSLTKNIECLNTTLDNEKSIIAKLEKNCLEKTEENKQLLLRVKKIEEENSSFSIENEVLRREIIENHGERAKFQVQDKSKLDKLEKDISRLEKVNKNLEREIQNLKSLLSERDEEIENLLVSLELNANLLKDERNHKMQNRKDLENSERNFARLLNDGRDCDDLLRVRSEEIEDAKRDIRNLQVNLERKEKEIKVLKEEYNAHFKPEEIQVVQSRLNEKERRLDKTLLELQQSNEKLKSANHHVASLVSDVSRLEVQLEKTVNEKNELLAQFEKNNFGYDDVSREILNELKSQIAKEKAKVVQEQEKCYRLLNDKSRLEKEIEKLHKELCHLQSDLDKAFHERRALQHRMMQASNKVSSLEDDLQRVKRRHDVDVKKLFNLEERVEEEQKLRNMTDDKMRAVKNELEREADSRVNLEEKLRDLKNEKSDVWVVTNNDLKNKIKELEVKNEELNRKVINDAQRIKNMKEDLMLCDDLKAQVKQKDQLVENLRNQLVTDHNRDAMRYQRELKKMRMKYEILARNELNQKLSEVNAFLDKRSREQIEADQRRDIMVENIQNDLCTRLHEAKTELADIKNQMKATERGIIVLQRQLQERELELSSERSSRRRLEKQLEYNGHSRIIQPLGLPLPSSAYL